MQKEDPSPNRSAWRETNTWVCGQGTSAFSLRYLRLASTARAHRPFISPRIAEVARPLQVFVRRSLVYPFYHPCRSFFGLNHIWATLFVSVDGGSSIMVRQDSRFEN